MIAEQSIVQREYSFRNRVTWKLSGHFVIRKVSPRFELIVAQSSLNIINASKAPSFHTSSNSTRLVCYSRQEDGESVYCDENYLFKADQYRLVRIILYLTVFFTENLIFQLILGVSTLSEHAERQLLCPDYRGSAEMCFDMPRIHVNVVICLLREISSEQFIPLSRDEFMRMYPSSRRIHAMIAAIIS